MNQEVGKSIASGNDTKLKHFIYLDRSRLNSYTAQISDGLTQIRRLSETISQRDVSNPIEEYQEQTREKSSAAEGSIGANIAMKVASKGEKKQTTKSGFKSQDGLVQESSESRGFSADKVEHDNLYLLLERDLIQSGLTAVVYDSSYFDNPKSQIVKITANTHFFEWAMIHKLLENPNGIRMLTNPNDQENFPSNELLDAMLHMLNVCSIGSVTAHLEVDSKSIVCSLNPDHFVITMDQLRGMYILPGNTEITIVGFLPKTRLQSSNITGLAGQFNMADLWKALVGDVDFVLEPIAIYSEIGI
jgi:hypothetical protein